MNINVIKRNGQEAEFDASKIKIALTKANESVADSKQRITSYQIEMIVDRVCFDIEKFQRAITVEEIQNLVERHLMDLGSNAYQISRNYITYRNNRKLARESNTTDDEILSLVDNLNEEIKQENSNKNATIASTQRDYIAGQVSRDITNRVLLPQDIVEAHKEGIIHFHDADYFIERIHNCDLINLEDMLQNGTMINGILIEKPHKLLTAMTIATQIITSVASQQYGGCSISLTHLAPFVRDSYIHYIIEGLDLFKENDNEFNSLYKLDKEEITEKIKSTEFNKKYSKTVEYAKMKTKQEIKASVQTFNYQINSMSTTNGQAPFITVFMYLNETKKYKEELVALIKEFFEQRIIGFKNEKGVYITPSFPKLIYVLEEDNINDDSKYFYLTKLAAKCTAKRLVPDYISEKIMKELKEGNCYTPMGCRSFLTPWKNENGNYKFYGRFNKGVVTINLPDVALSSLGEIKNKDLNSFWKIFDERLELCHKALICRYKRLKGTKSDIAPILWQHGALARLKKGEVIDNLLIGGYSTISLGYAGLWECVKALKGKTLIDEEGQSLALDIMKYMNKKCDEWNAEMNLGFGIYGTPLESTTYKFAKSLQRRFGVIEGITDKNYITNSYHIHVTQEIDAFTKLEIESKFQVLSTSGAISYVEVPNMQNNIPAVISIMRFIYNNIMYAELNTKSDYCQKCGYDGEIQIITDKNNKLVWECPNCKNRNEQLLNIARRTCGYIGSNFWNQGRTQEIKERVLHL